MAATAGLDVQDPITASDSSSTTSGTQSASELDELMEAPSLSSAPYGPAPNIPKFIGGKKLKVDDRIHTFGYIRYVLSCATHNGCSKSRNAMTEQCAKLGIYEPIGFLGAWQSMGHGLNRLEHGQRNLSISLDDQTSWLEANGLPTS